jgi:hypothetical protein
MLLESIPLGQLYAVLAYRNVSHDDLARERLLVGPMKGIRFAGRVELSRWAELLDYVAGLLRPRSAPIVLPDDLTDHARRVAGAIELLIGLRDPDHWQLDVPFTFTRRFAAARAGLTVTEAKRALAELRDRKVIVLAGRARMANQFRLGRADDVGVGRACSYDPDLW